MTATQLRKHRLAVTVTLKRPGTIGQAIDALNMAVGHDPLSIEKIVYQSLAQVTAFSNRASAQYLQQNIEGAIDHLRDARSVLIGEKIKEPK